MKNVKTAVSLTCGESTRSPDPESSDALEESHDVMTVYRSGGTVRSTYRLSPFSNVCGLLFLKLASMVVFISLTLMTG